jgi:phospholipid/cholesterol/gamma-HCH transport system substrate-binding protein
MTPQKQNALVGLFILGGLIALGTLIVKFGEAGTLFGKGYIVRARFHSVAGIREGTVVQLSGVPVGKVIALELQDKQRPSEGVFADLEIDRRFAVPAGSRALVLMQMFGQPMIDIEPPLVHAEPLPKDGTAEIHGEIRNVMESMVSPDFMTTLEKTTAQIGELAEAMAPAATAVKDILEQRTIRQVETPGAEDQGMTANLYTAVERLHRVLKHFDDILGDPENQKNLSLTLSNFRQASEEAKLAATEFKLLGSSTRATATKVDGIADKLSTTLDTANEHIDDLGGQLVVLADKLSRLLDHLITVSSDLSQGKGTAGLFLRDPKLYDELMLTIKRLGTAASEMTVLVKKWQEKGILAK